MTDVESFTFDEGEAGGLQKMVGSIERIIYANEENGYAICDVALDSDEVITMVGTLPYVREGDTLSVWGKWVHNPKYGKQFRVEQFEKSMPESATAILRYLSSRVIKGIGPKTAQKIVDEFGEETFDVIENHPEYLAEIQGITHKKAMEISEDFKEKSGMRSAMMFFRDYFGAALTVKIYNKWKGRSIEIAKSNPYRLCAEIDGIGFEKADAMAAQLGFAADNIERVMSGVKYLLSHNATRNGHVCLPKDKVIDGTAALLSVNAEIVSEALSELLKLGEVKYSTFDGVQYMYDTYAYTSEKYIANKLVLIDRVCASVDISDVPRLIEMEEISNGIRYASLQKKAIIDALENGVTIITGGPGTGKTTVVRALIHIFGSMEMDIALAAPTGRAAKRLSESTSLEAKTIHRLLEMEYSDDDGKAEFGRNEQNLLDEEVIIVDEASMADNFLMCALLKAIKPGARIIIIGDSDQLPSVGAGNVLRDLIDSERFATVRLNEIFRQAQMSLIVTNAHRINNGEMPQIDVRDNDFFFLPRTGDAEIAYTVADLYKNRLPRSYGPETVNNIQVITPSRKGEAGTENLNFMLQNLINPKSQYKKEYKFRDVVFREGDRVMQIKNNYDIDYERSDGKSGCGIFNGDIGVITSINFAEQCMEIEFDERHVIYDFTMLGELEHSYAITVHKSQGSEYPIVIIPLYSAPSMLLTRNMLYTAVTRAQKMVILVGREDILATMVKNDRQTLRYTGLMKRLQGNE